MQRYHTPLDDLEHVDLATMQDKGDHLLAMARTLGNAELRQTSGNAVWFDVVSRFMILCSCLWFSPAQRRQRSALRGNKPWKATGTRR